MTPIARTTRKILTAFAVAIAALLVLLAIAPMTGRSVYVVSSGSMGRSVPTGSIAVTHVVPASAIEPGDVISLAFVQGQPITTHRVLAVQEEDGQTQFVMKGDANRTADPRPVAAPARVRRVEHVVPLAGYLVAFVRGTAGRIAFLAIPLLGLLVPRLRRRATPSVQPG